MTTGTYRSERGLYDRPYSEKEQFLKNRFYPGELGMVILLMVASLLMWSVAIYGLTSEPSPPNTFASANNNAY